MILSRMEWPISKSAVKRSCVSGSTSALGSSGIGGGSKKLKKLSFLTCLVIVRTLPLLLCFCFFFTVLTVRFLPSFQLIVQPLHLKISGPSKLKGSSSSGSHFISYSLVRTEFEK